MQDQGILVTDVARLQDMEGVRPRNAKENRRLDFAERWDRNAKENMLDFAERWDRNAKENRMIDFAERWEV